jgi:hypothetical protein
MKKAPCKDFKGSDIYEGSIIKHPSGQQGVVVFRPDRQLESDQWLINYGDNYESRLCLQITRTGKAIVM